METRQRAVFKTQLKQWLQDLAEFKKLDEQAAATVTLDQTRVGRLSRMDALQGQAMSVEMKRRREVEQRRVVLALQRIENDEYGYCARCDEGIAVKRLQLDPAATLCIACATKAEQG